MIMIAYVNWQPKIYIIIIYSEWATNISCETQMLSVLNVSNYKTTYYVRGCKTEADSPNNCTRLHCVAIIVPHSWNWNSLNKQMNKENYFDYYLLQNAIDAKQWFFFF